MRRHTAPGICASGYRLTLLLWRTANCLDLEAVEIEGIRTEERHRVLRAYPGRPSILPAVPQRRSVKGSHACAVGSRETHVQTSAGVRTAFARAIEYPEDWCRSGVWAVAYRARAFFAPS